MMALNPVLCVGCPLLIGWDVSPSNNKINQEYSQVARPTSFSKSKVPEDNVRCIQEHQEMKTSSIIEHRPQNHLRSISMPPTCKQWAQAKYLFQRLSDLMPYISSFDTSSLVPLCLGTRSGDR